MTPQQIFDNALFGIRQQGYKQARTPGGGCEFRTEDGLKCAIGHSLPGWVLDTLPYGAGLLTLREHAAWEELFGGVPARLLTKLQNAHDITLQECGSAQVFERCMQTIATEFNLTYSEP